MNKFLILAASAATLVFTSSAFAESNDASCVATGASLTKAAIKAKATDLGYNVRRVKTENGCFEVYAISKDGAKVEVFMHPTTGKVVKIKQKS